MTPHALENVFGALGGVSGLFGSAGMQQGQLAQMGQQYGIYTNRVLSTANNFGPVQGFTEGERLPKGASPADPPEYLWLKRRIEEVCWTP